MAEVESSDATSTTLPDGHPNYDPWADPKFPQKPNEGAAPKGAAPSSVRVRNDLVTVLRGIV